MSDNFYNIYYDGPISPIVKQEEFISPWSENKYLHYKVHYIEPIPQSRPFVADLVALSNATVIGANALIAQAVVAVLQVNLDELIHLRWEPLDDVEGAVWQLGGHARFNPRGGQARVSLFTQLRDPYLASTTFWILGGVTAKDAQIGAFNPNPIALPMARFAFWGYRYGGLEKQANAPLNTTYLPAQAMSS
jgi:hypothetical protein